MYYNMRRRFLISEKKDIDPLFLLSSGPDVRRDPKLLYTEFREFLKKFPETILCKISKEPAVPHTAEITILKAGIQDAAALAAAWRTETLASAGLGEEDLSADEMRWLDGEIAERMETMRLDARGVQRALAARLQRGIISRPDSLGDAPDAGALADRIKSRSLELIIKELGAEVLP